MTDALPQPNEDGEYQVYLEPGHWSMILNLLHDHRTIDSIDAHEVIAEALMPHVVMHCDDCGKWTDIEGGVSCPACDQNFHIACGDWKVINKTEYCMDCIDAGRARKHANKEWPYDYST